MRYLLTFLTIVYSFQFSAQNFCYTNEKQEAWFLKHPELKVAYEKHREEVAKVDKEQFKTAYNNGQMAGKSAAAAVFTIPVVFHILHTGGGENISDAQVKDAVNILTRDYNSANADTANV